MGGLRRSIHAGLVTSVVRHHAPNLLRRRGASRRVDRTQRGIRFIRGTPFASPNIEAARHSPCAAKTQEAEMKHDKAVGDWLEIYDNPMEVVVRRVRETILHADPRIKESMKGDAPTFSYRGTFATIYPDSKKHVSLMVERGGEIPGHHPRLEGSGDTRRVLKVHGVAGAHAVETDLRRLVRAWCDWRDLTARREAAESRARAKRAAGKKAAPRKKAAARKRSARPAAKTTRARPAAKAARARRKATRPTAKRTATKKARSRK